MAYKNKYHARKCTAMEVSFDSKLEAKRALVPSSAVSEGRIRNLRRQVRYERIPRQAYKMQVQLKPRSKRRNE